MLNNAKDHDAHKLDATGVQGSTTGKITFEQAQKGQPLVNNTKPVYSVEFHVSDPVEKLAVLVLMERGYVVFKKHCGPAIVKEA